MSDKTRQLSDLGLIKILCLQKAKRIIVKYKPFQVELAAFPPWNLPLAHKVSWKAKIKIRSQMKRYNEKVRDTFAEVDFL